MKNILYYDRPAASWEQGLPVGNGRIGAMIWGEAGREILSLNEDTLWSGYPRDYNDETAYDYLAEVRKAVFGKRYKEAEEILNKHMTGVWTESYLPMADLVIETLEESGDTGEQGKAACTEYERRLDLEKALCTSEYRKNGNRYSCASFCSFPDQVLVVRLCSDRPADYRVTLSGSLKGWNETDADTLFYHGWCPEEVEPSYYPSDDPVRYHPFETTRSIRFETGVQVKVPKEENHDSIVPRIQVKTDGIEIRGCTDCVLLVGSANSFVRYNHRPDGEYRKKLRRCLEKAAEMSYESLLSRHLEDYGKLFGRVELDLGHTQREKLPMGERLKLFSKAGEDPELIATAFQFGRYLLIAGSREGSQPSNLQGIWNREIRPPWSSNYTVNINLEMNYWPAEKCSLPECAEPLIRFVEECAESGKKTASVNYHCRGWCLHHNVDLWRKTTAVGPRTKELNVQPWSFWLAGGGWLCRHVWEHYRYADDDEFLRKTAYPLMRECAAFYLDWLVEKNGELVTCPSTSPENMFVDEKTVTGVSCGTTMDMDVIRELFLSCICAAEKLGISSKTDSVLRQIESSLPRLAKRKIGKHGQIQEWSEDFEEHEISHRHLSMLYGLYPSDLFLEDEISDQLQAACAVSLERRGEDSVAWSRAWKICLQARLKNGRAAGDEVMKYLQLADSADAGEISYSNGGIYENLFAARPFQIDGCFGFCAGIAEMPVQEEGAKIKILPAIPEDWKCGYVKGLRLREGRYIDIEWDKDDKKSSVYR